LKHLPEDDRISKLAKLAELRMVPPAIMSKTSRQEEKIHLVAVGAAHRLAIGLAIEDVKTAVSPGRIWSSVATSVQSLFKRKAHSAKETVVHTANAAAVPMLGRLLAFGNKPAVKEKVVTVMAIFRAAAAIFRIVEARLKAETKS
jgi:hypothetical protein